VFATILLASTFLEEVGGKFFVALLLMFWLISKFLKSDAAKKAAANKAIDIIGKWFR
jgi:hypothetical protein